MQIGSAVYNHLSMELSPKKRNTTHKSSALKEVYTNMARYNKQSPLFMLSLSDTKQARMINIKEAAISLQDVSESFQDASSAIYSKKVIFSENEDIVSGGFRSHKQTELPSELLIRIDSLATEQSNVGNYVSSQHSDLFPGVYGFDIETTHAKAHFALTVEPNDTNETIFNTLSTYINNRSIDVNASVLHENNLVALMLSSTATGETNEDGNLQFSLSDTTSGMGIVAAYGLNNVSITPTNSRFTINGEEHTSSSNHISINQAIELDFHATSEKPVSVRFLADSTVAKEQAEQFIEAYNSLVRLSEKDTDTRIGSRNLYNDISRITASHKEEFAKVGLSIDDKGLILTEEPLFSESIENGSFSSLFCDSSTIKKDITLVTRRLSLDPMAYINKTMVSYPDTTNKSGTTYTQSNYSGLMFNNYA